MEKRMFRETQSSRLLERHQQFKDVIQKQAERIKQYIQAASTAQVSSDHYRAATITLQEKVDDLTERLSDATARIYAEKEVSRQAADASAHTIENLNSQLRLLREANHKLDEEKRSLQQEVIVAKDSSDRLDKRCQELAASSSLTEKEAAGLREGLEKIKQELAQKDLTLLAQVEENKKLAATVERLEPLTQPRPHVEAWVDQQAYKKAAAFTHSSAGPKAAVFIRKAALKQCPTLDLDKLRLFKDERVLEDGSTLVMSPTTRPPIFFDSDVPSEEAMDDLVIRQICKNRRYEDPDPVPREVPLKPHFYAKFRVEEEMCARKQERLKRSQEEADFAYYSTEDDYEDDGGDEDEDEDEDEDTDEDAYKSSDDGEDADEDAEDADGAVNEGEGVEEGANEDERIPQGDETHMTMEVSGKSVIQDAEGASSKAVFGKDGVQGTETIQAREPSAAQDIGDDDRDPA